ncbi:phytolongin Phyl1.1-like [Typha latifolia]|uniref:phytolongin Phyl1.1-like n=1 Tax=Typha latifolia TaxID=4733 RepID=UPI003C2B68C6
MTGKTPIQMGSMVYFCIAKGTKILHSYNGGDAKLDALALRCLERTPPLHAWYFHTVREKTYGFLMEDGFTYFAISDPSIENFEALWFLEHLRDGFKKVVKKGPKEESTAVIHQLITLLQNSRNRIFSANQMPEDSTSDYWTPTKKAPLLGKIISKQDKKKKTKEKATEVSNVREDCSDQSIKIDAPPETVSGASSRKSSSLRVHHNQQQQARKSWRHHVKIILAIDALLVLVLFGIWLAVCAGFQCIS